MNTRFFSKTLVSAVTLAVLSACGDSDLDAIAKKELDAIQLEDPTQPGSQSAIEALDLSSYELVFSDEFNGGSLDAAVWKTSYEWGSEVIINNELQYYVDIQAKPDFAYNPFSFDGESLIITADQTPAGLNGSTNNQSYVSGVVSSATKYDLTYGYIEARVDFPAGEGLWPALWMLGSEFKDLKPQLFIAEVNGGKPDSIFHNYNYIDATGNLRSPGQYQIADKRFEEGFHTVGVSWEADEIVFYINGTARYRVVGKNISSQKMYVMANLAVGGVWTGVPRTRAVFPAEYKIDYIRAYKKKAE